jgi:hypothetical protein
VTVKAELNPTEDESRVLDAIGNLTGSRDFKKSVKGKKIFIVQEGSEALLIRLRALLRSERILDAARKIIQRGIEDRTISFCVNKQVAYAGHVSFCRESGESPLGPISFTITTEDPKALIDWLATKTIDGFPVE